MLISSSFQISPNVIQASLGDSMRWLVRGDRGLAMIDGCSTDQLPLFEERLKRLQISYSGLQIYRLFTSDDASRLYFPAEITSKSRAIITNRGRKHIPSGVLETSAEGASLDLGSVKIRRISLGLAHPTSAAFLIEPDGVLIGDSSLGFYRGRELPAPAISSEIAKSPAFLRELCKLPFSVLCLPWTGALSGALGAQHLRSLAQTIEELISEFQAQVSSTPKQELQDLLVRIKSDLEQQLFCIPEEFKRTSTLGHELALKSACETVLKALQASIPTASQ